MYFLDEPFDFSTGYLLTFSSNFLVAGFAHICRIARNYLITLEVAISTAAIEARAVVVVIWPIPYIIGSIGTIRIIINPTSI